MSEVVETEELKEPTKHDDDKIRLDLFPPIALWRISRILTFGAKKYAAYNYMAGKGLGRMKLYRACLSHLTMWIMGAERDDESGFSHLDHAGCCIVMLIQLDENRPESDDRPEEYKPKDW